MSTTSPVHVEVSSPIRFERTTLLVRILLAIFLGWLGITAGWVVCLLFVGLPLIAAIAVLQGSYDRVAPQVVRVLAWLLELSAFMLLLTDRLPRSPDVRIEMPIAARPTPGRALLRLITSLPSGLVLMCLWFVSSFLWVIAAFAVLFGAPIPRPILGYQRGLLRWQGRLVAYHASLVDEYPPFSFDTGDEDHAVTPVASEAR